MRKPLLTFLISCFSSPSPTSPFHIFFFFFFAREVDVNRAFEEEGLCHLLICFPSSALNFFFFDLHWDRTGGMVPKGDWLTYLESTNCLQSSECHLYPSKNLFFSLNILVFLGTHLNFNGITGGQKVREKFNFAVNLNSFPPPPLFSSLVFLMEGPEMIPVRVRWWEEPRFFPETQAPHQFTATFPCGAECLRLTFQICRIRKLKRFSPRSLPIFTAMVSQFQLKFTFYFSILLSLISSYLLQPPVLYVLAWFSTQSVVVDPDSVWLQIIYCNLLCCMC